MGSGDLEALLDTCNTILAVRAATAADVLRANLGVSIVEAVLKLTE